MKNRIFKIGCLIVLLNLVLLISSFAGSLRLGSPFQEHMVLQREMPIQVWGETTPEASVKISLGEFTVTTKADSNGVWKTNLPSQKAGGPFQFSVNSNSESVSFNDIMIGEVWICSGQSNMFMGYDQIPDIKALEADAKNIRTFKVKNTVAFSEQNYLDGEWKIENPGSAVAFSFAYFLQKASGVPVGIILTSYGSSSIEGWMPRDMTEKLPHFKAIMDEFDADTDKKKRIDSILTAPGNRKTPDDIFLRTQPNILYNAMMKPLAPYSCRGIVWYQGEANSKTMEAKLQYGTTLPLWIERLRKEWGTDNLHFLAVMLPGYGGDLMKKQNPDSLIESPSADSWAWIRESQFKALALHNTAIANTIDLGDASNIHPKDKLPVGQRLALLAEHYTLGRPVLAEGPVLEKATVRKNTIVVRYSNSKGLKTTDGKAPAAFWLADNSGKWVQADATIKGETIVLKSKKLPHPLFVRYAFAAKPEVNLVNEAGLPARPFRTDQFQPLDN